MKKRKKKNTPYLNIFISYTSRVQEKTWYCLQKSSRLCALKLGAGKSTNLADGAILSLRRRWRSNSNILDQSHTRPCSCWKHPYDYHLKVFGCHSYSLSLFIVNIFMSCAIYATKHSSSHSSSCPYRFCSWVLMIFIPEIALSTVTVTMGKSNDKIPSKYTNR